MSPLRRYLRCGFEPQVSNHLLSVIFECGPHIFKNKHSLDFEFRKASAAFKTTSRERRKTAWKFTRVEARTERTAQRRSLRLSSWPLKHGHCDQRSCCF